MAAKTRMPVNRSYEQSQDVKAKLEMSTAEIGLAVRTTNCLEERGVFTVNDLLHCTREDLLSISNFGEKTLEEVYKSLERIGFYRPGRARGAAEPPREPSSASRPPVFVSTREHGIEREREPVHV